MNAEDNPCPVPAPKLLWASALKERCGSCHRWVQRYPEFMGEADGYWQCEHCFCTSVLIQQARPYSLKSREWEQIVEWFEDCWTDIPPMLFNTVRTEPPLSEIDWQAIEAWYRSQHIYRWFITAEVENDGA